MRSTGNWLKIMAGILPSELYGDVKGLRDLLCVRDGIFVCAVRL